MELLFDGLTPQNYIWVSPTGSDQGTGAEASPLATIQAAVNRATAGTAIMVTAGEYYENVKLPNEALGTPDNPIWLISADGAQEAKIIGVNPLVGTIYGYGTDNYVIRGFEIQGGFRGIQFSQEGRDFDNLVANVLVEGNVIHDTLEDGIKIGQADNAYVVGNTIYNVAEEGIDFLAVNNGVIAYNDVSNAYSTAAGIFAKGGSTGVLIHNNYIHDIPIGDGISIGGQTSSLYFRPGYTDYEAKDVLVTENYIEDVARRPVNVKGALDSEIIDNYLIGNPRYYAEIAIQMGSANARTPMYSANIEIAGNILVGNQKIIIHPGNDNNINIHDNTSSGPWSTPVGADAYFAMQPAITGTSSAESLYGTVDNNVINAYGGADKLYGSSGGDTMRGGAGQDYLYGNLGADILTGGDSYDRFVFNTSLNRGIDSITDFTHGADVIWLENGVFTALTATGPLGPSLFYNGPAAQDPTDVIIYNPATGALSYDPDGNGPGSAVEFALLQTGLTVTASDFFVV